jgi:LysR family nitrogen assimilation transcriptional regulator
VQVTRSGSFSRAAVALGVSQPYLSQRIGLLETELRRHLFLRHGRGIALTDAGKRFFETAVNVLSQLEVAAEAVAEEDAQLEGKITIGLPPSVVCSLSVQLVRGFIERFPKARLAIVEQLSSLLQDSLLTHRVDIAFMFNPALTGVLETTVLASEPVCLISRSDAKMPSRGDAAVSLATLATIPLILPSEPHPLRSMLEIAAASHGVELNIPYEVDGVDAILHLVEEGIASTVSTARILQRGRYGRTLQAQPLTAPEMSSVLCLATAAKRPRTVLMQRALSLTHEVAAQELHTPSLLAIEELSQ